MPLDGLFLHKLCDELNILVGGKISKVLEVSDNEYILAIRANYKNYQLFLSLSNEYYRIHLTNKKYEFPQTPKSFTMLLRKYLEGNIINSIKTYQNDRIVIMECQGLNEIGDLEGKQLIIELMGKFSNLILTKNNIIIDVLKKQSSIDSKRIIFPNAKYEFENQQKLNPYNYSLDEINNIFNEKNIISSRDLSNTFQGVSLLASSYIMNLKSPALELYNLINSNICPNVFNIKNKMDYYFTTITDDIVKKYNNLSEMMDDYYFEISQRERIKQKTNDLALTVDKKIIHLENKITKLHQDLDESNKADLFKLYGELLIANSYITKKSENITVLNYYTNNEITIPLDIRYNIIDNSKIYYKKYQKAKNAKEHINQQIDKALDEIEYLKIIKSQIESASMFDILEIKDELYKNKYISSPSNNKNKKKQKTKILTYILEDGKLVYVGKNNIQNELVTHKIARPNSMWFHIKDAPGSHVILLDSSNISEYDIRTCAMIASFYSSFKNSSSVPVDYTYARYIKKIPGKRNCFVTYTNQKTIYIDPDKEFINNLNEKVVEY